ncbi:serine threonine protein partial : Serine/threonine protein kinase (Fragment) OS=Rhodopirellula maiorica SM1 GN=RMSM_03539 PE=4 SV=1: Pkinase: LRR_5: LRR_6 [Gemmataceae bacterium]
MVLQDFICPACRTAVSTAASAGTSAVSCPGCGRTVAPARETVPGLAGFSGSSGAAATDETLVAPIGPPRSTEFPFLAPPQRPDELGRLGSFRVLGRIGAGGMGAVFRAEDPGLRRLVALKVMLPQFAGHPTARARFLREARAQAAVEHNHIVAIYQVGEEGGVPFITMPLLKGESLADALAATPTFAVEESVRVAREVAEGLAAAHAAGLVHRDIKPANVWLEGPSRHVKVLDFGLARAGADGDPADAVTVPGAIVGTPAYMSPEQATGEPVDARTDLFSLGVVLYQMLTGRQPFTGKNTPATLTAVASHTPAGPAELNRAVPTALSTLTMRLLSKAPADRPASAGEVVEALREVAAGAGRTELPPPEPKRSETRTPVVAPRNAGRGLQVGAGVALVVLAVLVVAVVNRGRDGTEPPAKPSDESPVAVAPPGEAPRPAPGPESVEKLAPHFDDRTAAQWAIKLGGAVRFDDGDTDTKNPADLPKGAFRLTGLSLVGERVTDADLARFNGCANLTRLDLPHSAITDAGLANFKACKNLTHLDLTAARVTDAGLACFDGCKNLTQLTLDETTITGSGLVHFKNCAGLRGLSLGGCSRVTDAGLEHVKGLKNLTALDLNSTQVTDAGLAYFKECIDLKELNLARTGVTATGLAVCKDFKRLLIVYLDRTPTTDVGLAHLMTGDGLSSIFLRGTKVTKAGVAAFSRAQPSCRVEWEGGVIEPK